MSDKDDGSKITLSRRKALGGLGTIGVAGALGLGGTYAQFTDTEATQISFGAGKIDGEIAYAASYNGEDVGDSELVTLTPNDGENGTYVPSAFELTDVKPGDYGSIVFDATVQTNPAWPILCIATANDDENGIVEPEKMAEEELPNWRQENQGELDDNLLLLPFYDTNLDSSFFDADGPTQQALDNYGTGTHLSFWDNGDDGSGKLFPRSLANLVTEDPSNQIRQGTVQWNEESDDGNEVIVDEATGLGDLGVACFALNGAQGENSPVDENVQGVNPLPPGDNINFGFDWHLPYTTGNGVQTDSVDIHFVWIFQQLRHSEGPQGPFTYDPGNYSDGEPNEGDDVANDS